MNRILMNMVSLLSDSVVKEDNETIHLMSKHAASLGNEGGESQNRE